jgi:hypothetical protein
MNTINCLICHDDLPTSHSFYPPSPQHSSHTHTYQHHHHQSSDASTCVCLDCTISRINETLGTINDLQHQRHILHAEVQSIIQPLHLYYHQVTVKYATQQRIAGLKQLIRDNNRQIRNKKLLLLEGHESIENRKSILTTNLASLAVNNNILYNKSNERIEHYRHHCRELHNKLHLTRKQRIEHVLQLYPIRRKDEYRCSVNGLSLVDDTDRLSSIDHVAHVSSVMGYIVMFMHIISQYTAVKLPYDMRYAGSNSYISDTYINGSKRYYLTYEHTDYALFRKAVNMLGTNIQFLCMHHGVTNELRSTSYLIPNLLLLIQSIQLDLKSRTSNNTTGTAINVSHTQLHGIATPSLLPSPLIINPSLLPTPPALLTEATATSAPTSLQQRHVMISDQGNSVNKMQSAHHRPANQLMMSDAPTLKPSAAQTLPPSSTSVNHFASAAAEMTLNSTSANAMQRLLSQSITMSLYDPSASTDSLYDQSSLQQQQQSSASSLNPNKSLYSLQHPSSSLSLNASGSGSGMMQGSNYNIDGYEVVDDSSNSDAIHEQLLQTMHALSMSGD